MSRALFWTVSVCRNCNLIHVFRESIFGSTKCIICSLSAVYTYKIAIFWNRNCIIRDYPNSANNNNKNHQNWLAMYVTIVIITICFYSNPLWSLAPGSLEQRVPPSSPHTLLAYFDLTDRTLRHPSLFSSPHTAPRHSNYIALHAPPSPLSSSLNKL